jgi:hypothetical protein
VKVKNTFIDFGAALRSHKGGNAARRQSSEPPPFTKAREPSDTDPESAQQNRELVCEGEKNAKSLMTADSSCEAGTTGDLGCDDLLNQANAENEDTSTNASEVHEITTEMIESSSCKALIEKHEVSEVIHTPRSAGEPEWEPDAHTLHLQSRGDSLPIQEPAAYEQCTWNFVPVLCASTMFQPVFPSMELAAAALAAANAPSPPDAPTAPPSRHRGGAKNLPWRQTRHRRAPRTPNNTPKAPKDKGGKKQVVRFCSWCGGSFEQYFKFCQFCGVPSSQLKA